MSDDARLLWMFKDVYGEMAGACYAEVYYEEDSPSYTPDGVKCMKHNVKCWAVTKTDIMFDYLTMRLK